MIALLAGSSCGGAPERPDVVLFSLDSVRADALTFRDPGVSPRLAALAQRGAVFEQAIAGTSWTLPAHVQMFTGQPPALHGSQLDDLAIDPATPTLPMLLQGAGYQTAGWWTGWYVAGDYGFERGFDLYQNGMTGGEELERMFEEALGDGDVARARAVFSGRDVQSHQDVTSPNVLAKVESFLGHVDPNRPLFLFVHLFDPHYDYVPPAPWDVRFDPDYSGSLDGRGYFSNRRIFDPDASPQRRISERDREHIVSLYRGEIGWSDEHVGAVLDLLRDRRGLDDTLLIVTADHGEEFFEHGGRGHRHSLYDEVLRVPLLVVPPGGRGGGPARIGAQVGLSDLLPTVLDYAGLPAPRGLVGRSLRQGLEGVPLVDVPQVSTLLLSRAKGEDDFRYDLQDALRTPTEKLVRTWSFATNAPLPQLSEVAWFDLATDPGETAPVTDSTDPRVLDAWDRLEAELDVLRALGSGAPAERRLTQVRALFAGDLVDLGYAGADDGPSSPSQGVPWPPGPHPRLPGPRRDR